MPGIQFQWIPPEMLTARQVVFHPQVLLLHHQQKSPFHLATVANIFLLGERMHLQLVFPTMTVVTT
jgi:hypothetical protein